jgi:hypothetical protein
VRLARVGVGRVVLERDRERLRPDELEPGLEVDRGVAVAGQVEVVNGEWSSTTIVYVPGGMRETFLPVASFSVMLKPSFRPTTPVSVGLSPSAEPGRAATARVARARANRI